MPNTQTFIGRFGWVAFLSPLLLGACSDHSEPSISATVATPASVREAAKADLPKQDRTSKYRSPITINYHSNANASIGEPVAITLDFGSVSERGEFEIHYRSSDPQKLSLATGQPETVQLEANTDGEYPSQIVNLLPHENGRFYLHVSAGLHTEEGLLMRPFSVPVQVGASEPQASRQKTGADENTEQGISLPASID